MKDYLVRATDGSGFIRALVARTTSLVEEARGRHATSPTATAALGRALTGTGLLAGMLKDGQTVTLRISGGGPLGTILCDGDSEGHLRGYVTRPQADLPLNAGGKLDVGGAVGRRGEISVARGLGLKEPYTGKALLVSGEIAEDLTNYLTLSEQTPSLVGLGVLVDRNGVLGAGGLLLQLLPGAGEEHAVVIEKNVDGLAAISSIIHAGASPEDILEAALKGLDTRVFEKRELRYACRCSRDKTGELLASLGHRELEEMIRLNGGAELKCWFCNEVYFFGPEELKSLLQIG